MQYSYSSPPTMEFDQHEQLYHQHTMHSAQHSPYFAPPMQQHHHIPQPQAMSDEDVLNSIHDLRQKLLGLVQQVIRQQQENASVPQLNQPAVSPIPMELPYHAPTPITPRQPSQSCFDITSEEKTCDPPTKSTDSNDSNHYDHYEMMSEYVETSLETSLEEMTLSEQPSTYPTKSISALRGVPMDRMAVSENPSMTSTTFSITTAYQLLPPMPSPAPSSNATFVLGEDSLMKQAPQQQATQQSHYQSTQLSQNLISPQDESDMAEQKYAQSFASPPPIYSVASLISLPTLGSLTMTDGTYFGKVDVLNISSWTPRYIVVAGPMLYLFPSPHAPTSLPLSSMKLTGTCTVTVTMSVVTVMDFETWTIKAQSEDEAEAWGVIVDASVKLVRAQEVVLRLHATPTPTPIDASNQQHTIRRTISTGSGLSASIEPSTPLAALPMEAQATPSMTGKSVGGSVHSEGSGSGSGSQKSNPSFNIKKILAIRSGGNTGQHVFLVRGGSRKPNVTVSSHLSRQQHLQSPGPPKMSFDSTDSSTSSQVVVLPHPQLTIPVAAPEPPKKQARVFMIRGGSQFRASPNANKLATVTTAQNPVVAKVESEKLVEKLVVGTSSFGKGKPPPKDKKEKEKVFMVRGGGRR
ncbi:hypothetical protein HDU97_006069 [Phlyctochytrium planicorne]|nr:hypothetical protein HDU97_006069 [Phlyctochytrium planicorne]